MCQMVVKAIKFIFFTISQSRILCNKFTIKFIDFKYSNRPVERVGITPPNLFDNFH